VRTGRADGIDGLFLDILQEHVAHDTGETLPDDITLTALAHLRADALPRALVRYWVRCQGLRTKSSIISIA
jgi:hypothetical protein